MLTSTGPCIDADCWIKSLNNFMHRWKLVPRSGLSRVDRVGLRTNFGKKVSMVCRPCQAAGNLWEAAYGSRITGVGPMYREQLMGRVSCREYG